MVHWLAAGGRHLRSGTRVLLYWRKKMTKKILLAVFFITVVGLALFLLVRWSLEPSCLMASVVHDIGSEPKVPDSFERDADQLFGPVLLQRQILRQADDSGYHSSRGRELWESWKTLETLFRLAAIIIAEWIAISVLVLVFVFRKKRQPRPAPER